MSTLKHIFAGVALAVVGVAAHAQSFQENFNGNGVPANWIVTNNSSPIGTGRWGQGNENIFAAQAGAPSAYFSDSFDSASSLGGAISDWLITPTLTIQNGNTVTFWARSSFGTPGDFFGGNILQLRLSSGSGSDVGTTATSLGTFTQQLALVNLDTVGAWTRYSATISGLSGSTGRLAFRYVVGDTTTQGDYIGLDTVAIVPEPEMALLLLAGLPLIGFGLRRKSRG